MRENHAKCVKLDRLTNRLDTDEQPTDFKQKKPFHYYFIHFIYFMSLKIFTIQTVSKNCNKMDSS